nr:hypothetical protein [Candidatus Sigynarchaeota archaeon]
MLATTHAFIAILVAAILYWKAPPNLRPNHGRFMLYAMACGMLVDFDFLSGFLDLLFTNAIPLTLQQFINEGRQNHPIFTHHAITLGIALVAVAVGLAYCVYLSVAKKTSPLSTRRYGKHVIVAGNVMLLVAIVPQLLLKTGSYHFWGIDDAQRWTFNIAMVCIFMLGIVLSIIANVKRPAYVLVLGLGISLHFLCDFIQYWVVVLGPFDPAWAVSMEPLIVGLNLYSDSDYVLGGIIEGPFNIFFIVYLVWYFTRGKKKIEGRNKE